MLRLNRRPVFDDRGVPLDADAIAAACTMAEAAFATRRKTLSNSCKTYFAGRGPQKPPSSPAAPAPVFERAGIDPRLRGETLDASPSSSASAAPSSRSLERFGR